MRWDANQIARFARGGGFVGPDVAEAVALALASSGGLADYEHSPGSPGIGRYVGLWGIDTDRWPAYAEHDLHMPYVNATVAHELTEWHGGFDWSPTFRAGAHRHYRKHAGTESTREMAGQAGARDVGNAGASRQLNEAHATLARTRQLCTEWALGGL